MLNMLVLDMRQVAAPGRVMNTITNRLPGWHHPGPADSHPWPLLLVLIDTNEKTIYTVRNRQSADYLTVGGGGTDDRVLQVNMGSYGIRQFVYQALREIREALA